jgi:hypothetical protein
VSAGTAGLFAGDDAFKSPGHGSDIAIEVVTNLAQWRLFVDPDCLFQWCGTMQRRVLDPVDEMRVLTQSRGGHSPIHQGLFADPTCSTQHRESWHVV